MKRTKLVDANITHLQEIRQSFETQRDSLQEIFDGRSEKWQEGEKGEQAQSDIDAIENIIDELQTAEDSIENLYENE